MEALKQVSGVCYSTLKQVSGVCYGALKQLSGVCYGALKQVSRVCYVALKQVSRVCYGDLKQVSGVCYGALKQVSGVCYLLQRPEIGVQSLLQRPEIGVRSFLWRPEIGVRSLLQRPEKGMIFGWSQTNQIAKKLSPVSNSDFLIPIYMNSKGSNHRVEKIKGFENQSLWQIMNSVASENIQSKQKYKWSLNVLCFYYHLSISVPSLFKRAIFLLMCNLSITIFISVFHLSLNVQSSY